MKSDRRLVKYGLMLITLSLFIDGHCYGRQAPEYYNVRQFGAAGDGMVYDTQAIQSAIDSASKNGGGVIYFPPGIYLTRTIILTDHITLHIEQGALILGSKDLNKYDPAFGAFTDSGGRKFGTALIFAENAQQAFDLTLSRSRNHSINSAKVIFESGTMSSKRFSAF